MTRHRQTNASIAHWAPEGFWMVLRSVKPALNDQQKHPGVANSATETVIWRENACASKRVCGCRVVFVITD